MKPVHVNQGRAEDMTCDSIVANVRSVKIKEEKTESPAAATTTYEFLLERSTKHKLTVKVFIMTLLSKITINQAEGMTLKGT